MRNCSEVPPHGPAHPYRLDPCPCAPAVWIRETLCSTPWRAWVLPSQGCSLVMPHTAPRTRSLGVDGIRFFQSSEWIASSAPHPSTGTQMIPQLLKIKVVRFSFRACLGLLSSVGALSPVKRRMIPKTFLMTAVIRTLVLTSVCFLSCHRKPC